VADGLAEWLTLALGEVALAEALGTTLDVAEKVPAGENEVGIAEGEDPVQAETDAEASTVKAAQPAAVANLARSPVPMMVVRIFMGPPHASGRWRTRFLVSASEEKLRAGPLARACRRQVSGSTEGHKGNAMCSPDGKWPVPH
jgi:hypothetical protein